ncbi:MULTISPECIES: hypothetical protein [Actinomycetes]|uniref:Uncharacterized protein n=1 Tax=Parafrankia colletiae TaxID=573497 RepID=A0A1S1QJ23_9ACTN|nr:MULTISPECIES: hypothetical protein [Actinomycetes]MCK9901223.1 hypothetical protein [Frankia sp. Cpl3]OHV33431.1 hypothetical protein CC117_22930 [Parafrankia colletiae]TLK47511.1 hypothetical protein FDN03_15755 [Glutamicibacter sp. V16R2B1]
MSDFDTDLLEQTEVWVDQTGHRHRLDEMDLRYLRNVRRYLERKAPEIREHSLLRAIKHPLPSGTQARQDVEAAIDRELLADGPESATDYMAQFPLYRRIWDLIGTRLTSGDTDPRWLDGGPF